MTATSYLLRTFIFALAASLLVLGLNFVVDPYGITGVKRISNLNEYKVEINEHTGLMKKYQPLFESYNALIVGNSRVEMGMNPSHRCFQHGKMNVYKVNVDEERELAQALSIQSIPRLLFAPKEGKPAMVVGSTELPEIKRQIKELLKVD